jgi:pyruvate dehydrogenase E2 component (dihydrolipoamide acetyltransferase)
MADFLMPALGADMETGKVVQWLVQPGSRVKRGDVVAVVETHKGAIDVEIFLDGVIDDLVPVGEERPVGAVLAHVREVGEGVPSTAAPATAVRAKVSPVARRRAHALGIDPDLVHGTGSDGAITLADVERSAPQAPAAPAPPPPAAPNATERPRAGFDAALMRQAIARAMSRSKREIPHYYLTTTIDFGAAAGWLDSYNRDRAPEARLLPAALLLKAAAMALTEVPQLNGFFENDAVRAGAGIHIGWAIALRGGGLVAPAIHDVDRKALPDLMAALRDLVQRARTGGLRSSELTDPTVTVTSVGDRGADCVLGVIYPPQVAILGFGRVVERPWVIQGRVQPRPLVAASLAADHRASDGHIGGLLLAAIDRALQQPEAL